MQVKCVLCDLIEDIEDYSPQAKRLRNRKTTMYLCKSCYDRIEVNTIQRHETGKFHLYQEKKQEKDFI